MPAQHPQKNVSFSAQVPKIQWKWTGSEEIAAAAAAIDYRKKTEASREVWWWCDGFQETVIVKDNGKRKINEIIWIQFNKLLLWAFTYGRHQWIIIDVSFNFSEH